MWYYVAMQNYRVTCLKCKNSDVIGLTPDNNIIWGKNTFIISGRFRLDRHWGFQCFCGNNALLTTQEEKRITNKQSPDPKEIALIIKNLIPDKPKFVMEKA